MIQVIDIGNVAARYGVGTVGAVAGIKIIGDEPAVINNWLADVGGRAGGRNSQIRVGQRPPTRIEAIGAVNDRVLVGGALLILQGDIADQVEFGGIVDEEPKSGAARLHVLVPEGAGDAIGPRRDRRFQAAQTAGAVD